MNARMKSVEPKECPPLDNVAAAALPLTRQSYARCPPPFSGEAAAAARPPRFGRDETSDDAAANFFPGATPQPRLPLFCRRRSPDERLRRCDVSRRVSDPASAT